MSANGIWKTTVNSPIGAQEATLEIVTSGDTFTGKMEGQAGTREIAGKVDGNNLTWSANVTSPAPMTLEFTVTINGDAMTGSVKAGAFGTSPLTGKRV